MRSRPRVLTLLATLVLTAATVAAFDTGPAAATATTLSFTAHCAGPGPTSMDRPSHIGVLAPDLVQPGQTFPVAVSIDYPISATATAAAARFPVQGADAAPSAGTGLGGIVGTPGAADLSGVISLRATGPPGGTITVGLQDFAQVTIIGSVGTGQTCTPTAPLEVARIAIGSGPPPPPTDPTVSVGDASIGEGTGGAAPVLRIPVTLSAPSAATVTVDATVHDGRALGSATDPAAPDYVTPAGVRRIRFVPQRGSGLTPTVRWLTVPVVADSQREGDEQFTVTLTNARGGYPILDGTGTGTILDDDGAAAPALLVGDLRVREGRTGTRHVTVPLTLSAPLPVAVIADLAISGGTASCPVFTGPVPPLGADCRGRAAVGVRIPAGATTAKVGIDLYPDTVFEPDETVRITVTGVRPVDRPLATPVTLFRPTGTVTIRDDD